MKLHTAPRFSAPLEPLEARIAPAVILANPIPDLVAGSGQTGAVIDLATMVDPGVLNPYRTIVELTTNVDTDPVTPGLQAGKIVIELYDDEAPLTVQNFLAYVNNKNAKGDYDNTFFHRLVSGFVLQGGGFDASAPGTHIPTFPTVHNEFDGVNRSNVRGTLAMAKVGGDPNSATSEWFINLADNSGNLDNQNGGFTVFGEVISGMEFVDAIAGLSTVNLGGALSDVPVQNYNADPDNNPSTPAPVPKADQFIRIVEAKVVPNAGNVSGVTYTIESIVPVGSTAANLVTGTIKDSTLNLKYTAGLNGYVDVTVKATPADGSEPVMDTFRVDVRPNLIIDVASDGLQGVVVPGDSATVKVNVSNTGAASATGTVDIQVGLIKTTAVRNSAGQITGFAVDTSSAPITIAELTGVSINLAGGKTGSYSLKVEIPTFGLAPEDPAADIEGTVYQLVAQITPKSGDIATPKTADTTTAERFSDDNIDRIAPQHHALNRFGTFSSDFSSLFGGRKNAALTYLDDQGTDSPDDDTLVTWTMKGEGLGRLTLQPGGGVMLETDGTDARSSVNAKVAEKGAHVTINGAQFYSTLGAANLGSVDLEDFLFAPAGVKTLTLGDVTGQALMLLGTFPPDNATQATLKFGRVQDLSLESSMPIASLTAIEWLDTDGTAKDSISALGLGTLKITGASGVRGDFEADLTIGDTGPVKAITVAGFLKNSTIVSSSDVGTVTLGGMDSSNLFAGVSERPEDAAALLDALTIKTFNIKGIKGFTGDLFIDSQVVAATLNTVKVQGVATASGDSPFGFVADAIKSYNRSGVTKLSKLDEPGTFDEQGNFRVVVL